MLKISIYKLAVKIIGNSREYRQGDAGSFCSPRMQMIDKHPKEVLAFTY
jgi:hypothetical protein